MFRLLLTYLLPLVAPFAIYALYVKLSGRKQAEESLGTSWYWLLVAGLLLLIASLVVTALVTGYDPAGTYVPPRYEGGRILPPEFR